MSVSYSSISKEVGVNYQRLDVLIDRYRKFGMYDTYKKQEKIMVEDQAYRYCKKRVANKKNIVLCNSL